MKRFLLSFIIISTICTSAISKEHPESSVEDYISSFCQKIIEISKEKVSNKNKIEKVIKVIDDNVNSKWIGRFVLGKHYRTFTKDQFNEFLDIYREFMIQSYAPKFISYEGRAFNIISTSNQKIFYNVKAEFYTKSSSAPIQISFRVKNSKVNNEKRLMVIDFIAEGISLLESQRSEIDTQISKKGVEKYLEDLDKLVSSLKKKNKGKL